MGVHDEWMDFLLKNPQFYEISKGDFFIRFLERIDEGAKSFSELRKLFPKIEEKDLETILNALLQLKVISKSMAGLDVFYTLSEQGKKLLSEYRKTKRFFST